MNPLAIRIAADLKEFKANMAELRTQLETNHAAMKRMANAFDGNKVIGDANAMVKAIADIGGASKLTEAEQKRVNATVTEAIAKYKALGREAPAELHALRDATKQVQAVTASVAAPVESLSSRLKGLAGTVGIAFGGAAVLSGLKSLASGALDYAEQISDLSSRMGVSAETAQRWKFAADQTGSSLESVQKAVIKLSDGIASGDKGLVGAVQSAGLKFAELKSMKPDEAFNAAVAAIQKIANPMDQARVALELFGKAGAELLPAIRQGFIGLADGAKVMSNDTIARLDEAKDNLEKFKNDVTIVAGEAIGEITRIREANALLTQFRFDKAGATAKAYADATSSAAEAATKAGAALRTNLAPGLMSVEEAERATTAAGVKTTEQMHAETQAALRLADATQKRLDAYTGKGLQDSVDQISKDLAVIESRGKKISDAEAKKLAVTLGNALRDGASIAEKRIHALWLEHQQLNPSIKVTTKYYGELSDAFEGVAQMLSRFRSYKLSAAPAPLETFKVSADPYAILKDVEIMLAMAGKNPNIKLTAAPAAKSWVDGFKGFMASASTSISSAIVGAIQGGGNVVLSGIASLAQSAGQFFTSKFNDAVKAGTMSASAAQIAGGLVTGIIGVGASIIADMFEPVYTFTEQLARQFGKTTAVITEQLKSMGAAGKAAFEQMTTSAGGFFERMRQRSAGFKDAQTMFGLLDQFQTKEELENIASQWKGVYDYMLASGKYTAAQLAEAWKRYEDAQKAAIGAVDPEDSRPMGARGFPTKAQLQQAASEAKAAYDYMLASGLYTTDVLEQAWQQWQDAMIASGDETAKRMKDLNQEIQSLQKAVEAETPEYDVNGVRIYGVEEQRNIERLAALEAEKAALQVANIEKEKNAVQVAAEAASLQADKEFAAAKLRANNLDDYLKKLFSGGYEIPISFRMPDGSLSGPGRSTQPAYFGGSSFGSTPVPSSATSALIRIENINTMDGEVVARKTVQYTARLLPNQLAFIGARR